MAAGDIVNLFDLDGFDKDEVVIPIDFQINDFRDIGSRQGSSTKTITITGSKKNDSTLSFKFSINDEGFFNDNALIPAKISRYNITLIKGNLQVHTTRSMDGVTEYDCVLYSENAEWFSLINDGYITDLDLGTHIWNYTPIRNSWQNNGDTGNFVYGLVDYGYFEDKTSVSNIATSRLKPHIFIKPIIKKILNEIGYTVKSDFLKKKEVRDLCILFTGDRYGNIPVVLKGAVKVKNDYRIIVENNSNILYSPNVEVYDKDEVYELGTTTIPLTGLYNIKLEMYLSQGTTSSLTDDIYFNVYKNGIIETTTGPAWYAGNVPKYTEVDSGTDPFYYTYDFGNLTFNAGDLITIKAFNTNLGSSEDYYLEPETFYEITPVDQLVEGSTISNAGVLPKISKKTFLKWFFSEFNLVASTDNRTGIITIEPRDSFYYGIDEADDWSEKIDYSKPYELEKFMDGLNRSMQFRYQRDENDTTLEDYIITKGSGFGDEDVLMKNEYLEGEKDVVNNLFASSYMGKSFTETLYMPIIYNETELDLKDQRGEVREAFNFKPRIAWYEGLVDGDWTFNSSVETTFPQMLFIRENSTTSEFSLCFNNLKDISPELQLSDVGLVDRYYSNLLNVFDYGRLLKIWMRLDATDISRLDFRKPKFLIVRGERVYFYLNKIENYLAGTNESTLCEFIPVKPSQSFNSAKPVTQNQFVGGW